MVNPYLALGMTALQNPAAIQQLGTAATNLLSTTGGIFGAITGRGYTPGRTSYAPLPPRQVASVAAAAAASGNPVSVAPLPGGGARVAVNKGFFDNLFGNDEGNGKVILIGGLVVAGGLLFMSGKK